MTLKFLMGVFGALLSVAFLTLLERKMLGLVGYRLGPNKVSTGGIFQPISDAAKLMNKQQNSLSNYSCSFYYLGSAFLLLLSLLLWCCLFSEPPLISLKYPFIILMLVLALNSLNSIICGWSSFSKFSLLGTMRTVSQLISYEASLYMCVFFFFFFFLSFEISGIYSIVFYLYVPFCFYIWWPSFLAELNRTPYDFSEGESELVSGFNTEFGSNNFTLIFLAEYANLVFFSLLTCCLFLGFSIFFSFFLCCSVVLWTRSVLPRYRFDKLMMLSWKFFIPFLTAGFLVYASWL